MISTLIRIAKKVMAWSVSRLFPIDSKKIVVSSYQGRGYGDNPKYIVAELLKCSDQLKIVWLVNNPEEGKTLPKEIIPCIKDSTKAIYHLSTAKVWIDNCRKGFVMYKRKKQFYLQTWHGFAIKRIEKDVADHLSDSYVKFSKLDSKMTDIIISDSRHMTKLYKESFWYDGKVLELGSPRNDIILTNTDALKEKVYKALNIQKERKLVLYAPTFRSDESNDSYALDYARVKASCEKRFGGTFSVLVRLHPNVAKNSKLFSYDGIDCINATYYSDMQELLSVSDIVISDYSSLMVDFALSQKPCFQFAVDIDEYKKDRNFYFDLEKLPFSLSKNNYELEKNILLFDEASYRQDIQNFFDSVGIVKATDASKQCAKLVLEKCDA